MSSTPQSGSKDNPMMPRSKTGHPSVLSQLCLVGGRAFSPFIQAVLLRNSTFLKLFQKVGIASKDFPVLSHNSDTWIAQLGIHIVPFRGLGTLPTLLVVLYSLSAMRHAWWISQTCSIKFPVASSIGVAVYNNLFDTTVSAICSYLLATGTPDALGWKQYFGAALVLIGLGVELYAEETRKNFKRDPRNKGKVDNSQLWGLVRHPNYLGYTVWRAGILDFSLPTGFHLSTSRSPTPLFHSSLHLDALSPSANASSTPLHSSLTYIFSSIPLRPLPHLRLFSVPPPPSSSPSISLTEKDGDKPFLLYGRLYFPTSRLDALYARRLSPTLHGLISMVSLPPSSSSSAINANTSSILLSLQQMTRTWSSEYSYSLADGMMGIKHLYNFPPSQNAITPAAAREGGDEDAGRGLKGVWSVGGEIFFSLLEKSGGMSTGLRFCTLPHPDQPPTVITFTLNPLMGNMSSTYSTAVTPSLSVGTRFEYNLFSYDSALAFGVSYLPSPYPSSSSSSSSSETVLPAKTAITSASISAKSSLAQIEAGSATAIGDREQKKHSDDLLTSFFRSPLLHRTSVLRARISTNAEAAILWEGKWKHTIWSVGVKAALQGDGGMGSGGVVRSAGVGVQWWS
ncbi:hypothetical protein BT69DRAFT_1345032 [Atractiella rhizophila]|nr:hypothetical protein BT69DRAFT_1345032 [Atractiella rhizophila]